MQRNRIWSSIEVVITGTTGNRVYLKKVPRVQIPPAPPSYRNSLDAIGKKPVASTVFGLCEARKFIFETKDAKSGF